jgi:hypothetical protein
MKDSLAAKKWKRRTVQILTLLSDGRIWTEQELTQALHPKEGFHAAPLSRLEDLKARGKIKLTLDHHHRYLCSRV